MSRLDPQDVRQGKKGTPVLRVLIAALVLCVLAGIGMAAYAWVMPDQTLPDASIGGGVGSNSAPAENASPATTPAPSN